MGTDDLAGDRWVALVDASDKLVVLAYAASEAEAANGAVERLRRRCLELGGSPFAVLASDQAVRIHNGAGPPLAVVPTAELLARYHSEASPWQLSSRYLLCLLEAWLSDLAYGWGAAPAPAAESLERIGLAARLRAGTSSVIPDENGSLRP